jgi:cytoskeletal protein RodZ
MAGIIGVLTNVDSTGAEQELYPLTVMEAVDGLDEEFAKTRKEASENASAKLEESKQYTDSKHLKRNATISTNWAGSAAPFTQEVSVEGVVTDDNPHITPVYSDDLATALAQKEAWHMVSIGKAGNGKIIFSCFEEKPTVSIPIKIEVNR